MITAPRVLALLTLCSLFMLPQGAQAQESEETVRLNQEASEAFQEGKFEVAATKFTQAAQKASTKRSSAVLVKNAMIAWFKVPKCTQAVSSARLFLGYTQVATLSESDIKDARTVIVKCRSQDAQAALAAGDLAVADAAITDVKTYTTDPDSSTELKLLNESYAAKKQAAQDAERARLREEIKGDEADSHVGAIVGGSLMGVGVIGAVVTFIVANPDLEPLTSNSANAEFGYDESDNSIKDCNDFRGAPDNKEQRCKDFGTDINDEIGDANTARAIGYSLSGAAFVGGAILLAVDLMGDAEPDPNALMIYPVLGGGQAGAALEFRF